MQTRDKKINQNRPGLAHVKKTFLPTRVLKLILGFVDLLPSLWLHLQPKWKVLGFLFFNIIGLWGDSFFSYLRWPDLNIKELFWNGNLQIGILEGSKRFENNWIRALCLQCILWMNDLVLKKNLFLSHHWLKETLLRLDILGFGVNFWLPDYSLNIFHYIEPWYHI